MTEASNMEVLDFVASSSAGRILMVAAPPWRIILRNSCFIPHSPGRSRRTTPIAAVSLAGKTRARASSSCPTASCHAHSGTVLSIRGTSRATLSSCHGVCSFGSRCWSIRDCSTSNASNVVVRRLDFGLSRVTARCTR